MSNCTTCPNVVGDSYERDCAFPDCVGGWEQAYIEAADEITRLRAASEDFAKMVLGDETYNNSPCQAHPFELVFQEIEKTTDKVTADWSERCQKLEAQRDRLLTLATKWCDQSHHDWAEIKRMADSA